MKIQYYRIAEINLAIEFNEVLFPKKLERSFEPFAVDSVRTIDSVLKVTFCKRPLSKPSFSVPCYSEEISPFCTWFGVSLLPSDQAKTKPDKKKMAYCYYSYHTSSNLAVCCKLDLNADEAEIAVCGDENQESCYCQLISMALWASFGTWSLKYNRLFLHSSVTVVGGEAILFLGESGTGKSTQSYLWQKYIPGSWLLNDDSPIIFVKPSENADKNETNVLVYGTPWSGKTSCYHSIGVPIGVIVRLSQGTTNQVTPLNTVKAFAALQPSVPPMLNYDEKLTDYIFQIFSNLIAKVDCKHMVCTPTQKAVLCLQEVLL